MNLLIIYNFHNLTLNVTYFSGGSLTKALTFSESQEKFAATNKLYKPQ